MRLIYMLFTIGSLPILFGSGTLSLVDRYLPNVVSPPISMVIRGLALIIVFHALSRLILSTFSGLYSYFKIEFKDITKKERFMHSLYMSIMMLFHFCTLNYIISSGVSNLLLIGVINLVVSLIFGYAVKDTIEYVYETKKKASE